VKAYIKLDINLYGVPVAIPTNNREIPGSTPGRYNLQIKITSVCRADSPNQEPCYVFPAGTGEGISARIHAANSQGDRAEEGRRSARRHNANSLRVRVESCVMLVAGIVVRVSRAGGVQSSVIDWRATKVKSVDRWARHPPCHPRSLPYRDFDAPCERLRV